MQLEHTGSGYYDALVFSVILDGTITITDNPASNPPNNPADNLTVNGLRPRAILFGLLRLILNSSDLRVKPVLNDGMRVERKCLC